MKNFLGFGEIPTIVEFSFDGTTLISGPNGVGKTSILNAVVCAIYGKPLSNGVGKLDSLVNNINAKGMELKLELTKDKVHYMIHRARKLKAGQAGNFVHIYKDGVDVTPDSVGNTNKLIENIMGVPYELFIRIAAVSATYVPFLDLPMKSANGANQTDIIEELFSLTALSEKAVVLKEQIKETKHSIEIQEAKIEALEDERARHEEQKENAMLRMDKWNRDKQDELSSLTEKLKRLKTIDVETEEAILEEIDKLEDSLQDYTPMKSKLKEVVRSAKELKDKTDHELSHLSDGKCPYCKQDMAEVKDKIKSANEVIADCNKSITENQQKLEEIVESIQILDDEIGDLENKAKVSSSKELNDLKSNIDKWDEKVATLEASGNPHADAVKELVDMDLGEVDMDAINSLDDLLKHQNMVLKLLTKKDSFVRKNLINKNIPYLNGRLNHYLNELKLTQIIEFKHDMTATVSQFGRKLDFGNLSAGQKARVNLAMSFAFRDVLQNMHGQINLCLLDEVLDSGLDEEGALAAANMLRKKGAVEGINIYVISHKPELQNQFDRNITVNLVDDFTVINFPEVEETA